MAHQLNSECGVQWCRHTAHSTLEDVASKDTHMEAKKWGTHLQNGSLMHHSPSSSSFRDMPKSLHPRAEVTEEVMALLLQTTHELHHAQAEFLYRKALTEKAHKWVLMWTCRTQQMNFVFLPAKAKCVIHPAFQPHSAGTMCCSTLSISAEHKRVALALTPARNKYGGISHPCWCSL